MKPADGENLLARWSRRKLETPEHRREEDETLAALSQPAETGPADSMRQPPPADDDQPPAPLLTDADMPPLESLTQDSDFSPFMSPAVSDELRNMALRKLFRAASFNIRDGLDEYDDDFTSFEKLGDIVTSDMKHQMEMEAKKKLEQEAAQLAEQAQDQATPADDPALTQATASIDEDATRGSLEQDPAEAATSPNDQEATHET